MLKRALQIYGVGLKRSLSSEPGVRTSLYDFHVAYKGKMVNFGGFQLPVQYGNENITDSHLHTRSSCSVFDVSHMLQTVVTGKHRIEFMESICTADILNMPSNSSALSLFTDRATGGILDDLIVTKCEDHIYVVSNASRRDHDSKLMLSAKDYHKSYGREVCLNFFEPEELSLLAIQGPNAELVLRPLIKGVDLSKLYFMNTCQASLASTGEKIRITRCGYTGEDGFEVSLPSRSVLAMAEKLAANTKVRLAGLGARDTLRLEAGLCLYGNDIDATTTPVSAGLMWTIGKRRKTAQDFPGAYVILSEQQTGPVKKRIGLVAKQKGPPFRHGCLILNENNEEIGNVTSGCPSPTLGLNIGMGYVSTNLSKVGTPLKVKIRNSIVDVEVVKMPFVKPNYYTQPK